MHKYRAQIPCHENQVKIVSTQTFPQSSGFLGFRLMSIMSIRLQGCSWFTQKRDQPGVIGDILQQFKVFQPREDENIVQQFAVLLNRISRGLLSRDRLWLIE